MVIANRVAVKPTTMRSKVPFIPPPLFEFPMLDSPEHVHKLHGQDMGSSHWRPDIMTSRTALVASPRYSVRHTDP